MRAAQMIVAASFLAVAMPVLAMHFTRVADNDAAASAPVVSVADRAEACRSAREVATAIKNLCVDLTGHADCNHDDLAISQRKLAANMRERCPS
jgi:hypothetical protein